MPPSPSVWMRTVKLPLFMELINSSLLTGTFIKYPYEPASFNFGWFAQNSSSNINCLLGSRDDIIWLCQDRTPLWSAGSSDKVILFLDLPLIEILISDGKNV